MGSTVEELDLRDVERELCRLPEVTGARIVADEAGRLVEVHVLARPGKPANQVVRDVQSVALATFGLEVDRRVISVVQLEGDQPVVHSVADEPRIISSFRPRIVGISAEASGLRTLVRVTLSTADDEAVGFAEGSIASTARRRLVAAATLDALRQLLPSAESFDVDSAQIARGGVHDIAVVTVVSVSPPEELMISGSAVVRNHQEQDAVARAVLDATNRRLPRLG